MLAAYLIHELLWGHYVVVKGQDRASVNATEDYFEVRLST